MSIGRIRIAARPEGLARPGVLIVDDRSANLLALEAILEPLDLELVRASSGEEALKQLLKKDFALLLLDVQMPGMDGFETAAAIKQHPRTAELPIIFITALNREASNVLCGYERGAVDYLMKPFDPAILRAKVAVFVDLYVKGQVIKSQAQLLHARELEALERQATTRVQALAESMPVIMLGLRPSGEVDYVNGEWTRYSGLSAAQTHGLNALSAAHADDVEAIRDRWIRARDDQASFEIEARLRRADGIYRWHFIRAAPERNESASFGGWIATATDVHERKLLQQDRDQLFANELRAREAAEAASRMKDEFLATVSHELRTPLNAILGWTRMLRSGMLEPPRVDHALATIERSAHVQTELIEDLLDVSRIISGKLRLKIVPFSFQNTVRAAVETVRPAAELKGVTLEYVAADDIVEMSGDPDRILQVVWNLASNAVKFTPKGGRVTLRVEQTASTLALTVADTGAGISGDFLPFVFDRFRQADNSSARAHEGLGLGLAIVRHLVELHGGQVRAESEGLGQGSTFTVTLPFQVIEAGDRQLDWFRDAAPRQPAMWAAPKQLDGMNVLFVDDHDDVRELFTEFLEHTGATVVTAGSADEALEALAKSIPHVLVSDIGLPGKDGYELIRQARALAPHLPAVAVSGYGRNEDKKRALDAGFQMHLSKPVDLAELVELIASLGGTEAFRLP